MFGIVHNEVMKRLMLFTRNGEAFDVVHNEVVKCLTLFPMNW